MQFIQTSVFYSYMTKQEKHLRMEKHEIKKRFYLAQISKMALRKLGVITWPSGF